MNKVGIGVDTFGNSVWITCSDICFGFSDVAVLVSIIKTSSGTQTSLIVSSSDSSSTIVKLAFFDCLFFWGLDFPGTTFASAFAFLFIPTLLGTSPTSRTSWRAGGISLSSIEGILL